MRKVRDIMSAAAVCMAPGESVSAAARAMKQQGIGVVSAGDLALESGTTSVLSGMSSPPSNCAGDRA